MTDPSNRPTPRLCRLPISFCQVRAEQTGCALLPPGRLQQKRPLRSPRANVFDLQRNAKRGNGRTDNWDGGAARTVGTQANAIARHPMNTTAVLLGAPPALVQQGSRLSTTNPGDGPEAAAG
jgi:hypothetical protein